MRLPHKPVIRPRLGRSFSLAGTSVTANSGRLRRNRLSQNSFNSHRPRSMASANDSHYPYRHPYRMDSENSTPSNSKVNRATNPNSQHREMTEHDVDYQRLLDADTSSEKVTAHSVISVASRLKNSLSLENDPDQFPEWREFFGSTPSDDASLNQEQRGSENKSEITSELKDISEIQRDHYSDPESDDDSVVMPCFDDVFLCETGDSNGKKSVYPTDHPEKDGQPEAEEHQGQHKETTVNGLDSNLIENELRKLDTIPLFDLEDPGFTFRVIEFDLTNPLDSIPCDCPNCNIMKTDYYNENSVDIDSVKSHADQNPDIRNMLCTESAPERKFGEFEKVHSLQTRDFREALNLQENYTCSFCGSNLEVILFDDLFAFPSLDDISHCSPYPRGNNDSQLFCPLCCETRLALKYVK